MPNQFTFASLPLQTSPNNVSNAVETLTVQLSNPSGLILSRTNITSTVVDDDRPTDAEQSFYRIQEHPFF